MVVLGSLFASADAFERYPIAAGQTLRCLLATLVLGAFASRHLVWPERKDIALIALLSLSGVVFYNVAILLAVRETDPAVVGVVVSCLPVVVALVSPLLARRLPSPRILAAALLVTAGAIAVQYTGVAGSALGLVLALAALSLEALFAYVAVPLLTRMKAITVATYTCAFAIPICALPALAFEDFGAITDPTLAQGAALLHLGLIVTPLSFAFWYAAIHHLGVERASLFYGLLPVSVLATAAVVGGTEITAIRLLGITLVAAGILLGIRRQREPALAVAAQDLSSAAPRPASRPNTVPAVSPDPPG